MTQNKIIVTIGRQFGSGGHEVGRRLASELADDALIRTVQERFSTGSQIGRASCRERG